jgi:hypothetical protein
MSTILDALKKSERERKLKKVPHLSSMRPPEEKADLQWLKSAALVVCSALLAGIVVMWLQTEEPVEPSIPLVNNGAAQRSTQLAEANNFESEAEYAEADAQRAVPRVSVGVISFAGDSERSFAILDGEMVRAGELLDNGMLIEEIKADVVVATFDGKMVELKP